MDIKVYVYSRSNYVLVLKLLLILLSAYKKKDFLKNGYNIERIVKGSWFKTESGSHLDFYPDGAKGPFPKEKRPELKKISFSPLIIAEIDKVWIPTCIPTYVFMSQFLTKYTKIIQNSQPIFKKNILCLRKNC